jgi:hypothetical protein
MNFVLSSQTYRPVFVKHWSNVLYLHNVEAAIL